MQSGLNQKVSILMPVKDESKYIHEAIESVLKQTYDNWELVIVDDGSTDSTLDIAKRFQSENPGKIMVLVNPVPGKVRAFNMAYKHASGEYITYFAGDDVLPQESIEKRIAPLLTVDKDEVAVSVAKLKTFSKIKRFDGVITPRDETKGSFIGGALMFNRKMAKKIFPIPEFLGNEDKWSVLHIKRYGDRVFHVPEIGILYRIHENNSSSRTDPFNKKTHAMHKRFIVYSVFLERYRSELSQKEIGELSALAAAETLRYSGDWFSILFMSRLSINEKARFIMHSNAFFYWLRIRLFSLLSGRG